MKSNIVKSILGAIYKMIILLMVAKIYSWFHDRNGDMLFVIALACVIVQSVIEINEKK